MVAWAVLARTQSKQLDSRPQWLQPGFKTARNARGPLQSRVRQ